jgi:hypothetical protein
MLVGVKMNDAINSQVCERADDLISFLYGELDEREARSFEQHRRVCRRCESELAAFGQVRQSVRNWRDESLTLTIPVSPLEASRPASNRSAWAAIRSFFEISPLWMKGATAFAAVLFCVLAVLAVVRLFEEPQLVQISTPSYTDEDFRIAVASQANILAQTKTAQESQLTTTNKQRSESRSTVNNNEGTPATVATVPRKASKPLSRSERNQLAADLRLISAEMDDGDSLDLLGDRINR